MICLARLITPLLTILLLYHPAESKQRVCIIGAGMAGLAAIKLLRDYPQDFETTAFEKNSDVGGLWIYTNSTDLDEHGLPVHSSVYKNLRINLPKEVMAYPDYLKFHGENRSYVSHESVLEYMRNYTEYFNLRQSIKLNTLVEKVTPIMNGKDWRSTKWSVKTRDLNTNASDETICNAVMVCNGAFFKPNIPKIPGMESFPGQVIHSHAYRRPEGFAGKTVVILGASASGIDISTDISSYAKTVYLSHRHAKFPINFPENLIQVRGVVSANGSELTLQDGSKIIADTFIFCTGYLHDYPFLDQRNGIFIEKKNHVRPLYKYFLNVEHPSMALIGVPHFYVKGTYFYSQVKYFRNLLRGKITLPNYDRMIEDSKIPLPKTPSVNGNQLIHDSEWDYNRDLANEGEFEHLPSFYQKIMDVAIPFQTKRIDYHEYDLKFLDNGDPTFVRTQET